MALINLGAGLSELGKSVAQTAQNWTLESQRADLEKEKIQLANELAASRESAGRQEAHGYAMEEQGARLAAEGPLRAAQTASLTSGTSRSEEEFRRKNAAGDTVSSIFSGGGGVPDSYAKAIGGVESRGGKMIPNELGSGAYGPYQFMPQTWADVRAKNPELNLPEDMRQATAEQHKAAFDRFTASNAKTLQEAGVDPTPTNLYLAHRFGAGGALKVIKSDENASLADVLPADWQRQNPDMRGQTVGGFKRLAEERMKGVTMEGGPTGGPTDTMPADMRVSIAALAKSDPKAALELRTRWQEHQQTLDYNTKAAAKLQIGDEGIGYIINPVTMKTEPIKIDGQTLKFRDPDVARRETELIRSLTTQLTDASRSYMPEILATEATVRVLQKDPMSSVDKDKQRELAEAKSKAQVLRQQYDEERKAPLAQLQRLGAQLTATGKLGTTAPGAKPPLSDLIKIPGVTGGGLINNGPM